MHIPDLNLGRVRLRVDFVLVVLGTGVVATLSREDPIGGATLAGALLVAIVVHELGHALAARLLGKPFQLVLQLTGGASYLGGSDRASSGAAAPTIVLLAGPLAGLVTFALGSALVAADEPGYLGFAGRHVRYMGVLWSVFQLLPFPPLDGGLLLRRVVLANLGSATLSWRLGWVLGFSVVLLLLAFEPRVMEPAIWLTGMAVVLGRAEAGYVRHVDAFEAWQRGEYTEVVARVRSLPEYITPADRRALLELGVAAALELEDAGAVEDLAAKLPAANPSCVKAAEWLLRRERPFGARLADQAFDALDAERVKTDQIDREAWADLAFWLAIHEARALKDSSALGLLDRAVGLGFDDVDRLEAEGAFHRLHDGPRWAEIRARMRSAM